MTAASRFPVELIEQSTRTLDVADFARAATAFRMSTSDDFAVWLAVALARVYNAVDLSVPKATIVWERLRNSVSLRPQNWELVKDLRVGYVPIMIRVFLRSR